MNKRFHIVVTDLKDGKVLTDDVTDCICGAYSCIRDESNGTACIGYSDCNAETLAGAVFGAHKAGKKMMADSPTARALVMMRMLTEKEEDKDDVDVKGKNEGVEIPFPETGEHHKS